MARPVKPITKSEIRFSEHLAQGLSATEAARKSFGWKVERFTREEQKAKALAASKRIKDYVAQLKQKDLEEAVLEDLVDSSSPSDWESLHQYAFRRLKTIRDNARNAANVRYEAVLALEKLADPAQDLNLIWKYIDTVWEGLTAHCPCCHADFPLSEVKNERLEQYRTAQEMEKKKTIPVQIDRRLSLLEKADKRRKPHPSQMKALTAPERNIVALGLARGGKCNYAEDKVILASGEVVKAKDLLGKSFTLLAYGPNGKQVPAWAYAEDNGIKPVFRITTKSGRQIDRTENHPLLTATTSKRGQGTRTQIGQSDWKQVGDLTAGQFVLVPRKLNIGDEDKPFSEEDCKLAGYLLGDGGTTVHVIFTQVEGKVKNEFRELVKFYNCTTYDKTPLTMSVKGIVRNKNRVLDLVREWKINCHSRDKRFPDWVWTLPNTGLALFLNRLFACDGWALRTKAEIGITLASEQMIQDVQLALLRLGINGTLKQRAKVCTNAKGGPKKCKAWHFSICSKRDILKFAELVGIFGKEEALTQTSKLAIAREDRSDFRETGCPVGYMWDEISSISPLGAQPTVAIYVDIYHTFLTTYVEHNSFSLGQVILLHMLMPGANVWLLARIYDDAKKEFEYLENFLYTMFYPVEKHMYTVSVDKKTGEASIKTRWNSILSVKSGKAKGSITGEELDLMAVAEPGWVDGELFEEVRARMSSRLGRIFAFGTPKGTGGFLGRLLKMSQRDMSTGKRLDTGARLIANGCPWGQSLLVYDFDAKDNPEYVLSEIEAAKSELTAAEFASEFQGKMVSDANSKFPFVKPEHARPIVLTELGRASLVLGVDQGERNFAAVLLGWNGENVFVFDEFFDKSDDTIKSNLIKLNSGTLGKVISLGLPPEKWRLTIFDADPPITGQLAELEQEGRKWKTDFTFRPKNQKEYTDWREETCAWINEMAKANRLVFSPQCDQLHDQVMEVLKAPENPTNEGRSVNRKSWVVNDPWRGDHVLDAFLLACWTVYNNALLIDTSEAKSTDTYQRLEQEFQFAMRKQEEMELRGYRQATKSDELYENVFGEKPRKKFGVRNFPYFDA